MRFSERYGHAPVRSIVQANSIDDSLRNSLWSTLKLFYWDTATRSSGIYSGFYISCNSNSRLYDLCVALWLHHFKQALDTLDHSWGKVLDQLRDHFFQAEWYEVYDFIEFVSTHYDDDGRNQKFRETCNRFLEREMSAYRFVSDQITRVVDEEEIQSIEDAVSVQQDAVREHLNRALALMSDRKSPDFRNSIKESISAVEALALHILGEKKGTLGALLARVEEKAGLHPALKTAFSKLYGYTSDADGIRHALLEESDLDFEDAKFMLVACSAFINYTVAKANH